MKKLKKIPKFTSEKKEQLFWQKTDSTDFIDWSKAELVNVPNLKSSTNSMLALIQRSETVG